jgi:hypothetical protein
MTLKTIKNTPPPSAAHPQLLSITHNYSSATSTPYSFTIGGMHYPVSWGRNDRGQLGNGTTGNSLVPVGVDINGTLAGQTVIQVSSGLLHACAATEGGRVACWGYNGEGRLGNGSTADSNVPVWVNASGILTDQTVIQISAGQNHNCATTSNGHAACWGYNYYGQLGNGGTTNSSVPVWVVAGGILSGQYVTQVSAGGQHSCALTNNGKVSCWGFNSYRQLGNGTTANSSEPVWENSSTLSAKAVTQISAGFQHTCVTTTDGLVACWGSNDYGQLGNGNTAVAFGAVWATIDLRSSETITQTSAGNKQTLFRFVWKDS